MGRRVASPRREPAKAVAAAVGDAADAAFRPLDLQGLLAPMDNPEATVNREDPETMAHQRHPPHNSRALRVFPNAHLALQAHQAAQDQKARPEMPASPAKAHKEADKDRQDHQALPAVQDSPARTDIQESPARPDKSTTDHLNKDPQAHPEAEDHQDPQAQEAMMDSQALPAHKVPQETTADQVPTVILVKAASLAATERPARKASARTAHRREPLPATRRATCEGTRPQRFDLLASLVKLALFLPARRGGERNK